MKVDIHEIPKGDPVADDINRRTQKCFQCNTCVSGCPVFKVLPEFKPGNIARQLFQFNTVPMINEKPAYWLCSLCLNCEQICPQDVDIAHIFYNMKNWAVENNIAVPTGIVKEAETMRIGVTAGVSQSILSRRKKMGLPELPRINTDQLDSILDKTGFNKKLNNILEIDE